MENDVVFVVSWNGNDYLWNPFRYNVDHVVVSWMSRWYSVRDRVYTVKPLEMDQRQ